MGIRYTLLLLTTAQGARGAAHAVIFSPSATNNENILQFCAIPCYGDWLTGEKLLFLMRCVGMVYTERPFFHRELH